MIAGGGVCNAGRIFNYLNAMMCDERHDVLFVDYQDDGTSGRVIQRYGRQNGYLMPDGRAYTIRTGVQSIGGYSALEDQRGLVPFVKGMRRRRDIRLVHWDNRVKAVLMGELEAI